jgi:hypothetical protein
MKRQIIAFHGTPKEFNTIDTGETGTFLSSSQWVAKHYAQSGFTHEVLINFSNALVIDAKESPFDEVEFTPALEKLVTKANLALTINTPDQDNPNYRTIDADSLARLSKASGFDGLIIENVYESAVDEMATEYVAFSTSQLKILNTKRAQSSLSP